MVKERVSSMPLGRSLRPLSLTPAERETLERWAGAPDRRLARRAALILAFAAGDEPKALARRFRLSEPTVGKWRARFEGKRLDGLVDAPRPGAPRRIMADDVGRVLAQLRQPPPGGQRRWTTRSLARLCGVSQTTVSRIWRAHGVDPRSGADTAPPHPAGGREPDPTTPSSGPAGFAGESLQNELTRLARQLEALGADAPPDQGPLLRVALEAVEAALSAASIPRMRAAGEGARLVRARTQGAISQARSLVEEAQARVAERHAGEARRRHAPDGNAS